MSSGLLSSSLSSPFTLLHLTKRPTPELPSVAMATICFFLTCVLYPYLPTVMHHWLGPSVLPSSMSVPCLSIGHLVSRWTSVHGHVAWPFTFNFMFIYCRYFTSLCFARRYIDSVCLFLVRCGLICSYTYERGCSRRCCVGSSVLQWRCVVGSIDYCWCRLVQSWQYCETGVSVQTKALLGPFYHLCLSLVQFYAEQCSEKMCGARRPLRAPKRHRRYRKKTVIPRSSRRPYTCLGAQNL